MKFLLAATFVCALGAPVASAMPSAATGVVAASAKADATILVAKRGGKKSAKQNSRGDNYGIRPLVGSGDY